jgi:hypothetical protein
MIITMSHRKEVVMRLSLNYEEKELIFGAFLKRYQIMDLLIMINYMKD